MPMRPCFPIFCVVALFNVYQASGNQTVEGLHDDYDVNCKFYSMAAVLMNITDKF